MAESLARQTTVFALRHESGQLKLPPEPAKTLVDVVEGGAGPSAVDAASRVFVLTVSQLPCWLAAAIEPVQALHGRCA